MNFNRTAGLLAIAVWIAAAAVAPASIIDDLIAYYEFEGNYNDTSGSTNVNNGAIGGGAPSFVGTGKFGQAVFLRGNDGNNDHVTLGSPADLNFGADTDFTVNMWIRMPEDQSQNNTGSSPYVDASTFSNKNWASGNNTGYVWTWTGGDDWRMHQKGSTGSRIDFTVGDYNPWNAWMMFTATYDRDGDVVAYINGTERARRAMSPGSVDAGLATNIGQDGTGSYPYSYWGSIDDTAVWQRALSAFEVKRMYGGGTEGSALGDLIYSFTGAVNNDWLNGGNWDTGQNPQRSGTSTYTRRGIEINIPAGQTANKSSGTLNVDDTVITQAGDVTLSNIMRLGDDAGTTGYWTVDGGTLNATEIRNGDNGSGHLAVQNGGTLNVGGHLRMGFYSNSPASTLAISGSATSVSVGGTLYVADLGGTSTVQMDDGTLNTGRIIVGDDGGTGFMTVNGGVVNNSGQLIVAWVNGVSGTYTQNGGEVNVGGHMIVARNAGAQADMYIGPGATLNVGGQFYMNDAGGSGSVSSVVMDGGIVNINGGNTYFNDDNAGTATVTLNGGTWNSAGTIDVSWSRTGTSHLHVNGGGMYAGGAIRLGVSGSDTGQSRIFLNNGLLQGNDLLWNMTDSLIVFTGGTLKINNANVSVAEMQGWVDSGRIDVSGAPSYWIFDNGAGFTVLQVPEPSAITLALLGLVALVGLVRRRRK